MPHSLPHIITQIRASGRTTTHGAILLAEVDRLNDHIRILNRVLESANGAVAALTDAKLTAPAAGGDAPVGIVSPSFKGAQAAVKREQAPLREALKLWRVQPPRGYRVFWSHEDQEWVGLSIAYPSLSHMAETPEAAIRGIIKLLQSVALDELAEITQETANV